MKRFDSQSRCLNQLYDYNYYNFLFFFFIFFLFSKKKTNAHTKKNICIHTSDNTRGVHNKKKKFQRKQNKKRRGSVWYEIVLKTKDFTCTSLRET